MVIVLLATHSLPRTPGTECTVGHDWDPPVRRSHPKQDDGNVKGPALVCTLVVCVCTRGEQKQVVVLCVSCCLTSAVLEKEGGLVGFDKKRCLGGVGKEKGCAVGVEKDWRCGWCSRKRGLLGGDGMRPNRFRPVPL